MEACLHFASRLVRARTKSFKFIGKSGIHWILKQHGLDGGYLSKKITIHKLQEGSQLFYYADLELYALNGTLVSEETVRDSFPTILIDFKPETVWRILEENFLIEDEETNPKLLFKVELHPVLQLEDSVQFARRQGIKQNGRQCVVRGVASLIRDPALELFYDVIIVFDNIKIKAHKCILFARMPELYNMTSKLQGSSKERSNMIQDDLEVVELKGSPMIENDLEIIELRKFAVAGFPGLVHFLYTTEYTDKLLTVGNLSITAKVMGSTFYQRIFLEKCMEKLAPETVIYVIYISELNKIQEYIKRSVRFYMENVRYIMRTAAWVCHVTFFNNLCRKEQQYRDCKVLDFPILKLSYGKVLKYFYELQDF